MSRVQGVTIRFPQYSEGSVLSYRDGNLQLILEDDDEQQSTGWATHNESKGVWTLTNLALAEPDGRIWVDLSSSRIWTNNSQSVPCAGGLQIKCSNGCDNLLLCISAASVAESCPSLSLELRNTAGSFAASFECAVCQQVESSVLPVRCSCSLITSVLNTPFDYVIIGTSFCAYAFVHQAVAKDPNVKILLLEKGDLFLLEHRQHPSTYAELPITESLTKREGWPWSLSASSSSLITNVKGQMSYYGGRSTFWSGWCPQPSDDDLEGWPERERQSLRQYFGAAERLLNVTPANKIKSLHNDRLIYAPEFQEFLETRCRAAEGTLQVSPGSIAMAKDGSRKFSTPRPLTRMACRNVRTIVNCTVQKILHDGKKATHLQTSQGELPLHNAKLILAMSTLPSTTLVLNSFNKEDFPFLANVGKRLTAHFVSSAIARVPRNSLSVPPSGQGVQLGAVYIAGKGEGQYHLQVSAVATSNPESKDLAIELCRQFSANSISEACIKSSPNHVLVSCSALGELDHKNKDNWFRLKEDTCSQSDLTSNGELQIVPNDQDLRLWDIMDDVMFKVMDAFSDDEVEYWHEKEGVWKTKHLEKENIRKTDAVHDASTMWIGEDGDGDKEAPVGLDYRLRGVENVYVTGGALWPTGGSWNPVLTIVAMAMHLADQLFNASNMLVARL